MEVDPTRVCELLVGLGDVEVLGVDDEQNAPLRVHLRRRALRPDCGSCGGPLWGNGERPVELVDLAAFGRASNTHGTSAVGAARSGDALGVPSLSRTR